MQTELLYAGPLGTLRLASTPDGAALCRLEFAFDRTPTDTALPPDAAPVLRQTAQQLTEYFAGQRREFSVPLQLHGTDFQRRVWNALLTIPYGEVRSYAQIAAAAGSPKGFRAVGMANHRNPVAIVVPCHRVVNADGSLGGYGGGLPTKIALLRLEGLTRY